MAWAQWSVAYNYDPGDLPAQPQLVEDDQWPPLHLLGPTPALVTIPLPWSYDPEEIVLQGEAFQFVKNSGVAILPSGVRYMWQGDAFPVQHGVLVPGPTTADIVNYLLSTVDIQSLPSTLDIISTEEAAVPNTFQPMKQGDQRPPLQAYLSTLNPDGTVTHNNITGQTVFCSMGLLRGQSLQPIFADRVCTIIDPVQGLVEYDWLPGDTATVGTLQGEFKAVDAFGKAERFPNQSNFVVRVVAQVGP